MRPGSDSSAAGRLALAAALVGLVLYLPALGDPDFTGDDEALDAGVVWQMAERGEWLFPEFNGEYLPPKPPLFYWAAAAGAKLLGGFDEFAVRLPSVVSAAATIAVTVYAGSALVGSGAAFLAGGLLAVMPIFFDQARLGRADMTMTFFTTGCLFLFQVGPEPLPRRRVWLFHVLLGLATLAKGAAALGLVVTVVGSAAIFGLRRRALRSLASPALVAFVALGGGWYLLAALHWGERFVVQHLLGENLRHFLGGVVSGEAPTRGLVHHLSHFVNLFTGTAPWGFALLAAVAKFGREPAARRSPETSFLLVWLLSGFVFFLIATRKSPYYLLPLYPPLALLAADTLWPVVSAADWNRMLGGRRWLGAGLLAACLVAVAPRAGIAAPIGEGFARHPLVAVVAITLVAGFGSATLEAALARRWANAITGGWATIAGALLLATVLQGPLADRWSLRAFARGVAREVPPTGRVAFLRFPLPAVALYSGRTIPTLAAAAVSQADLEYLIVPESLWAELPAERQGGASTVLRREARVFTRRRMGISLLRLAADEKAGSGREGRGLRAENRLPTPGRGERPQ